MNCPNCTEKCSIIHLDELSAHECFYCERVWAPTEMVYALAKNDPTSASIEDISETNEQTGIPSDFDCPCCPNVKLSTVVLSGIEIELCPNCSGILFELGELNQLYPNGLPEPEEPDSRIMGFSIGTDGLSVSIYYSVNLNLLIKRITNQLTTFLRHRAGIPPN